MGNKIQGEGDYESARRFNKAEQDFVKRKFRKRQAMDEPVLDASTDDESADDLIDDEEDTQIADGADLGPLRKSNDDSLQRR